MTEVEIPVCCGEHDTNKAGAPFNLACRLCPHADGYWRENREDGKPYEPVQPLSDEQETMTG